MPPISLKDIPIKETEEEDKGPELKMNIFIQKVQEMEDTEDTDEKWEDEDEDTNEFEQPNTSVVEAWNNKFWMICSEIIENFIYLGSQAIA